MKLVMATEGRGKIRPRFIIGILTVCLLAWGPTPARADEDKAPRWIAGGILGTIAVSAIAYGLWENLPQNQGKPRYLNGEFYAGGFMGPSLLQNSDWSFAGLPTAKSVFIRPGVAGGLKFGYFTFSYPWFGVEMETNFTRQDVVMQTINLSRPINGNPRANVVNQSFYIWTNAIKLMARYGFFPDQEVPFGRLQPYVGLGPGFVVVYGKDDSAKNFSLEVQAGVRYMMLKNVSAYLEYKFSKQWDIELENQILQAHGALGVPLKRTATFDVDNHKIVFGVAYHF